RRDVGRIAAAAFALQTGEILRPQRFLPAADLVEVVPGVQAAVVTVREHRLDRVVAHRLEAEYVYVALALLQHLLTGAVSAHFGGRRVHPQELERQAEDAAVVEGDLQHPAGSAEGDAGGELSVLVESCHGALLRSGATLIPESRPAPGFGLA